MATGKVIGGHYLNAFVSPIFGSTLVVQAPFAPRRLTPENVAAWAEVPMDAKGNPVSAVGKAVAAAVIPGRLGKAASAAVGATFDSMGPAHIVRVDWADGKQSLIKLPDALFKHFAVMLHERHVPDPTPVATEVAVENPPPPTVTDRAFDLVSGMVKDRWPSKSSQPAVEEISAGAPDITEQLTKLAALRDAGIVTDEEFATKKAELLARL